MAREQATGAGRAFASGGVKILRRGSSRILGVALVISSIFLFAVAFATGFLPYEIVSLVSFILGVSLLAVELEPRIRLGIAAEGMLGSLRALDGAMKVLNVTGKATYVAEGKEVKMVMMHEGSNSRVELPPVGAGLYDELEDQLGDMSGSGFAFFNTWMPRALVENLSVSDDVKVSREEDRVSVSMSRPFVRRLCIDPFVNANVCCRMGCPLAGAVAQTLAVTTGQDVRFENCSYNPRTQRAETTLVLGKYE